MRMSWPFSRIRPLVGSWNRATRSVTVVLPAPLRPTSATTEPPGTTTSKSAHHRPRPPVLERHVLEAHLRHLARRVHRVRQVRLVLRHRQHVEHPFHRRQRPLQLGERVHDVPHRVEQQERVPLEGHDVADRGAAQQVQVAAVPDDHHVDRAEQQAPRRPQITISRRWAKSSLRSTVWRPRRNSSSSSASRRNARTTRMPENVSPTRPSIRSTSLRSAR